MLMFIYKHTYMCSLCRYVSPQLYYGYVRKWSNRQFSVGWNIFPFFWGCLFVFVCLLLSMIFIFDKINFFFVLMVVACFPSCCCLFFLVFFPCYCGHIFWVCVYGKLYTLLWIFMFVTFASFMRQQMVVFFYLVVKWVYLKRVLVEFDWIFLLDFDLFGWLINRLLNW